jgi:hypothetical protein
MYESQRTSRKRKIEEGWKRVEAFLDPDTAALWDHLVKRYDGPTALVKAGLDALLAERAKRKGKA